MCSVTVRPITLVGEGLDEAHSLAAVGIGTIGKSPRT
jgi:hypothetical protein